jgi:hypothetical protein
MELVQFIIYIDVFLGGALFVLAIDVINGKKRNRKLEEMLKELENNKEA